MDKQTELKSCPFCGGEAHVIPQVDGISGTVKYSVYCDSRCGVVAFYCDTEAEAITAWNTRAERTCKCTTDDSAWCFVCSECGKSFPRNKLHLAHNHGEINYCPNCGAKVVDEHECDTCKYSEDASRYDPDDESELYTLMKCNLHGHVTDWPQVCEDWEGAE